MKTSLNTKKNKKQRYCSNQKLGTNEEQKGHIRYKNVVFQGPHKSC